MKKKICFLISSFYSNSCSPCLLAFFSLITASFIYFFFFSNLSVQRQCISVNNPLLDLYTFNLEFITSLSHFTGQVSKEVALDGVVFKSFLKWPYYTLHFSHSFVFLTTVVGDEFHSFFLFSGLFFLLFLKIL